MAAEARDGRTIFVTVLKGSAWADGMVPAKGEEVSAP
jgi:hypothetical protein